MKEKRQSSKRKLFYILDILKKYSDDEHYLNAKEIEGYLFKEYGINAERKSIYNDIDVLRDCGYNILMNGKTGYFLADRKFEIAEIRMLKDAVEGAKFITPRKTKVISDKLCGELSIFQADKIRMQDCSESQVKFTNEHILYVVDTINTAISENKRIHFDYYHKTLVDDKIKRVFAREHSISPYALIWCDEKYYVVGNYDKYNDISHYRVDRMDNVTIINEQARSFEEVSDYRGKFDVSDYAGKTFRMFSGKSEDIVLVCDMSILEIIIDKFGENVNYIKLNEEQFKISATGYYSEGLVDWLMMIAHKCRVEEPINLRRALEQRAAAIIELQSSM